MWICLNDGFFSIVEEEDGRRLLVRARFRGDIERVFGQALKFASETVQCTPDRDYAFRVFLPKMEVARVVAERVIGIDYGNFKASVPDERYDDLSEMYSDMWQAAWKRQEMMKEAEEAQEP